MAPLYPPLAITTASHGDIETAHHGTPDNPFLVLRFAAFLRHAAAAMRTALWQGNRDPFIDAPRNGAACWPAVAAPRFAAGALRIGFGVAARVRCGLTFTGAQGGFQLATETFRFL